MSSETTRVVTLEELRENKTKEKFFILLHGKVYDATNFIDEHPGGDEVILAEAGQDATAAFEDVGHSDDARALLPPMLVGELEKADKDTKPVCGVTGLRGGQKSTVDVIVQQFSNLMYLLPLGFLGAYFAYRFYSSGSL